MRIIRTKGGNLDSIVKEIRGGREVFDEGILGTAREIVEDVAARGDEALFFHTERLDGFRLDAKNVEVSQEEMSEALAGLTETEEEVIAFAAKRIRTYHERQMEGLKGDWRWDEGEGSFLGQVVRPLKRVGIYAPGGLASYPSTVLMAAVPARTAGVEEIILATPSRPGALAPAMARAAQISGIKRIFRVGGAQAIAALAHGTTTVPRVDKIVGPGNAYVAAAKKLVFGQVAIDMIAGPSEILIIADAEADPALIAADLLGQAEHDELAVALVATPSEPLAKAVAGEVARQLARLPRAQTAGAALKGQGAVIITADLDEAFELANRFAPEHLELLVAEPHRELSRVKNAGCVFLGAASPEAVGDYTAGSNHILPTCGTARYASPLGVYDFLKRISVVGLSPRAFQRYGRKAADFAKLEGFAGHAASIAIRDRL